MLIMQLSISLQKYLQVLDLFLHLLPSPAVEVSPPQWLWAAGFPHHHDLLSTSFEEWTLSSGSAPCHLHPSPSVWTRSGLHTSVSATEQQLSCSPWAPGVCHSWPPPPPSWPPQAGRPDHHCFSTWSGGGDSCGSSFKPNSSPPCDKINPHDPPLLLNV